MGALFGKKSKPKQPELSDKDRAILELKRQRDGLRKYKEKIALVVSREVEVCKTLMKNGQKKRALLALRKKKYQEQLMEKTDSQLFNIEEMVNSIEFAAVSVKVFDALKQGNNVLQAINAEVSIEAVEKLMDESAEAIEYQNVGRCVTLRRTSCDLSCALFFRVAESQRDACRKFDTRR